MSRESVSHPRDVSKFALVLAAVALMTACAGNAVPPSSTASETAPVATAPGVVPTTTPPVATTTAPPNLVVGGMGLVGVDGIGIRAEL